MKLREVCLLFASLIGFGLCVGYEPLVLNNGIATVNGNAAPCSLAFYSVSIPAPAVNSYLQLEFDSSVTNFVVLLGDSEFTTETILSDSLTGLVYRGANSKNIQLNAICPYSQVTTWYITVQHVDNGNSDSKDFTLTLSIISVPVNEVADSTTTINSALTRDDWANNSDFFHIALPVTSVSVGQTMRIQITGDPPIKSIALRKGGLPVISFSNNQCTDASSSNSNFLVVDYCTLEELALDTATDLYVAVQPTVDGTYTLSWEFLEPTVVTLLLNQATDPAPVIYSLVPNQIRYFQFAATQSDGYYVNATVENVQGGAVDFTMGLNELPFVTCLGGSVCNEGLSNCCDDISSSCELVVPPCRVQSGTFFLGVRASSFDRDNVPVTFQVLADISKVANPASLTDSKFLSDVVYPSHYNFYTFSPDHDDSDAALEFSLYVDHTNSANNVNLQTILYLNGNNVAGGGGCYTNMASCVVTNEGSCSVQVSSCEFRQYDQWDVSVFGGNTTSLYSTPVSYTVMGKLVPPTTLSQSFLVESSSLFNGQFQQFSVDNDILKEGSSLDLLIFNVEGGSLDVYVNFGGLAGPDGSCPKCFENQGKYSVTAGSSFTWPIFNCDSDMNKIVEDDGVYFAVFARTTGTSTSVSFSLTVDPSGTDLKPSTALQPSRTLVTSIQGFSKLNFTIDGGSSTDMEYVEVSISQVSNNGALPQLVVLAHNTSYIPCVEDEKIYAVGCTVDATGSCSFAIPLCAFRTTTDDWILQVVNTNGTEVQFNLIYTVFSASPVSLDNAELHADTLQKGMLRQYQYRASGLGSIVIEVFFDECTDSNGNVCQGTLYVSMDGIPGPASGECYSSDYSQISSTKSVFVLTSCELTSSDDVYFSVGTESSLLANQSFGFTVRITESNPVTSVAVNQPVNVQIYPGQRIYHTFVADVAPGVIFNVVVENEQNGQVEAVLSMSPPPFSGSCPCFSYSNVLQVDYCDATSGNWTVMTEATSTTSNRLVGYTLTVVRSLPAVSTLALTIAAPTIVEGKANHGQYNYYVFAGAAPPANYQLGLSVFNVQGGTVTVYTALDAPATSGCHSSIACTDTDSSCFYQVGSCLGTAQYVSVLAKATSHDPVTYSLEFFNVIPLPLIDFVASQPQLVPAHLNELFVLDATTSFQTMSAPFVRFTVSGVTVADDEPLLYQLSIFEGTTCESPSISLTCTTSDCQIELSSCQLKAGLFFLSLGNSQQDLNNVKVTGAAIDAAANAENVVIDVQTTSTTSSTTWTTFTITVGEDIQSPQKSLQVQVTSTNLAYFYFNAGPVTSQCFSDALPLSLGGTFTVSACCLQAGSYSMVMRATSTGGTVTILATYVSVFAPTIQQVTGTSVTLLSTLASDETQGFEFTLAPTAPYPAFWAYVTTDVPANFFLQRGSLAGPAVGKCLSYMAQAGATETAYFSTLQCELSPNQNALSQPYEGGSVFIGVQNAFAIESTDVNISVYGGMAQYVALQTGVAINQAASMQQQFFYTFSATAISTSSAAEVTITSDLLLSAKLSLDSPCGTALSTCTNTLACTLTVPLCAQAGPYVIVVNAPVSTTFSVVVNSVNRFATALNLNNGLSNAVTGPTLATATVSEVDGTQSASLVISKFVGSTTLLSVSFLVEGVPVCDATPVALQCTTTTDGTQCLLPLDSCQLSLGTYYFSVKAPTLATYQLSFAVVKANPIAITPNSVTIGAVLPGQRLTYQLTMTEPPKPGQSIEISLTPTSCGEVLLYSYQKSVAGPACSLSTTNKIVLSYCSAPTSLVPLSLTVLGGEAAYPDLATANQFLLEVKVTGQAYSFVPIGLNQRVPYAANAVFVLPVDGTFNEDFVGQLEVSLYGSADSPKAPTQTLNVQYDNFCGVATTLSAGTNQIARFVSNSCQVSPVQQVYLTFQGPEEDATVTFQVVHMKPFVRDLNEYNTIPQEGAVTGFLQPVSTKPLDEEYFFLALTPSDDPNFQFTAWLEDAAPGVQLLSSQSHSPSLCNANDADADVKVTKAGSILSLDWCQIDSTKDVFLTVDYPVTTQAATLTAQPYSLYYSLTSSVAPTSLLLSERQCDSLTAGETKYYSPNTTTAAPAGSYYKASIYSITGSGSSNQCTLKATLTAGGLATAACTNAVNTRTCSGLCGGAASECVWSLNCPLATFGEDSSDSYIYSIGVTNPGTSVINYYIVWELVQPATPALVVGTPTQFNPTPVAAPANTFTPNFFSLTLPALELNSQYFQIEFSFEKELPLAAAATFTAALRLGGLPSAGCYESSCTASTNKPSCIILLNTCGYEAGAAAFVSVAVVSTLPESDLAISVAPSIVTATATNLALNSFVEGTLSLDGAPIKLVTYLVSITEDMLANSLYGDLTVSVYGVNQGILSVVVGSEASKDCLLQGSLVGGKANADNSVVLLVDSCSFAAADYFVTLVLSADNMADPCTSITYGVSATIGLSSQTADVLVSGTPVSKDFPYNSLAHNAFSITPGDTANALLFAVSLPSTKPWSSVSVRVLDSPYGQAPTSENQCYSAVASPVSYFWGCSARSSEFFVSVTGTGVALGVPLLGEKFSVATKDITFTDLTTLPAENTFTFDATLPAAGKQFFTIPEDSKDAMQLTINLRSGPPVLVELWSNECSANGANQLLTSFTCYFGSCLVPVSWRNGELGPEGETQKPLVLTISGLSPSVFSLSLVVEATCVPVPEDDFCDIPWNVWNYATDANGFTNQLSASQHYYYDLVSHFCPPCSCPEISKSCNESLVAFACTQSYRACDDDDGLLLSTCEETCSNVEEDCGLTFEEVGLPWLSCNHNSYYTEDDSLCEAIFEISDDDPTDIILWIVVGIVILLVILILVAVIGFQAFRRFKLQRQMSSYETIDVEDE